MDPDQSITDHFINQEEFHEFENDQTHNDSDLEEEEETYMMDANNMYEVVESEYTPYYVHNEEIVDVIGMELINDEIIDETLPVASEAGSSKVKQRGRKNNKKRKEIDPNQIVYPRNMPRLRPGQKTVIIRHENIPPKKKKSRYHGDVKCPECNQTFINEARLSRHLSSHQAFGSFVCPLCTKIFKYEYNLNYHWRKTCSELRDLVDDRCRSMMCVEELRIMVEELVKKKPMAGPIDLGISKGILFQGGGPTAKLEIPHDVIGRRGSACNFCGVIVPTAHIERHNALHNSDYYYSPDEPTASGGFFCDLCGISYRSRKNLHNHWRTSCQEIMANVPTEEMTLDDEELRHMILSLLQRAQTKKSQKKNIPKIDNGPEEDEREPECSREHEKRFTPAQRATLMAEGRDHGIVYADDFGDNGLTFTARDGSVQIAIHENSKWKLPLEGDNSEDFQCPDCLQSFANKGRLDKHLMGFHNKFGKHTCLLCGSSFKYEYNLLYHYRKNCPYTRVYVEKPLRESLISKELRKIINNMIVQRTQLKAHLKRFKPSQIEKIKPIVIEKKMKLVPSQLLYVKPELSNRDPASCPFCQIVFYGYKNVERHVQTVHGKLGFRYIPPPKEGEPVEEIEPPPILERQDTLGNPADDRIIRILNQDGIDIGEFEKIDGSEVAMWLENTPGTINSALMALGTDGIYYEILHVGTSTDESGNKTYIVNIREDKSAEHVIFEEEECIEPPPQLEKEID